MKGNAQKIETLSDGSVKLSVYFNREDLINAAGLANKEVEVRLASDGSPDVTLNRQEQLQTLIGHADTIADAVVKLATMVKEELTGLEPNPEDYGINNQQEDENNA